MPDKPIDDATLTEAARMIGGSLPQTKQLLRKAGLVDLHDDECVITACRREEIALRVGLWRQHLYAVSSYWLTDAGAAELLGMHE